MFYPREHLVISQYWSAACRYDIEWLIRLTDVRLDQEEQWFVVSKSLLEIEFEN